jgi:rubrerythrin
MKTFLNQIQSLIKRLIRIEEAMAFLYEKYSLRFPKFELWKNLMNDEISHADTLKKLLKITDFEKISVDPRAISESETKETLHGIERVIKSSKKVSITQALAMAYKLECTISEQAPFKVFYTKDPEFKKVFAYLGKATSVHSQKVFNALEKVK